MRDCTTGQVTCNDEGGGEGVRICPTSDGCRKDDLVTWCFSTNTNTNKNTNTNTNTTVSGYARPQTDAERLTW